MSTAEWQFEYTIIDEEAGPVTLVTKKGFTVRTAREGIIHCRRNHQPTFESVGLVSNRGRLECIEILSHHLKQDDRWVGIFEDRDVLSDTYMDRVALPFHWSQWNEIKHGRTDSTIDHPSVDSKHRLIAKTTGIKNTVRAMEIGNVTSIDLGSMPIWWWWTLLALVGVVAAVGVFF